MRGNEASTAAANPRGNIIVIKVSSSRNSDLRVEVFTTKNRMPRKTNARNIPKKTEVKDERLNNNPVKTKKNDRIKKLI